MTVTERLQKPGQFNVRLRADAPTSALAAVEKFDHIVITPTRLLPLMGYSDANILDAAMYTGVITAKPDVDQFAGHGLGYWLGTDEGLGDLLDTKVSNTTATLSTWVTSLRPASLSAGTVTNTGTNLTYDYQYVSRREAMDHMCRAVGANYRINPDFTFDAAAPATLFTNYTTPKAVITRKPEGYEGTTAGIQGVDVVRGTDVLGYTTEVIVLGKSGDGAPIATGSASQATTYKDGLNGSVVMERFVNAPLEPAANVSAYAQSVLNLFSATQRQSVKLTSSTYAASLRVKVGDRVYVYDSRAGLTDSANQIQWRGQRITPVILQCKAITWPILRGYGVYARRSGATATYIDLSDWVEYEGTKANPGLTEWEVGTSSADVDQDPEQLGPAYLGSNPAIANRAADATQRAVTFLGSNVDNATTAFADVTGLSFAVESGKRYHFKFVIWYDVPVNTTGSAWGVNGPAGLLRMNKVQSLTATSNTFANAVTTFDAPAAANASSAAAAGNRCVMEGTFVPSASGSLIARFKSEVAASNVSARAHFSYVEWFETLV